MKVRVEKNLKFSVDCRFAILDQNDENVYMWNEDAPGKCDPENCPLRIQT